MTDEQIEKALEHCSILDTSMDSCGGCPLDGQDYCVCQITKDALALIRRQKAEISRLEYTLLGVMHSVDKWLEGDELKQDEVNRAITMREKTLRIVESLQVEAEWVLEGLLNPKCSACKMSATDGTSRYCPHCGAHMLGGVVNGTK